MRTRITRTVMAGRLRACWSTARMWVREGYARQWTGRREDWCTSLDERKPAEATLSCAATY
jgi:hypothetical protein